MPNGHKCLNVPQKSETLQSRIEYFRFFTFPSLPSSAVLFSVKDTCIHLVTQASNLRLALGPLPGLTPLPTFI